MAAVQGKRPKEATVREDQVRGLLIINSYSRLIWSASGRQAAQTRVVVFVFCLPAGGLINQKQKVEQL